MYIPYIEPNSYIEIWNTLIKGIYGTEGPAARVLLLVRSTENPTSQNMHMQRVHIQSQIW
jgi:hypothetical protein